MEPGARLARAPRRDVRWVPRRRGCRPEATEAAKELLREERSEVRALADGVRAFVEVLDPPLRLVVCGAGHDAIPLVRAASVLGWHVTVVDDRPAFLTRARFPEAAGFVPVEDPEVAAKAAAVDERTFAVVMTHNFLRDKDYLRALLGSPAAYIGMLGPAARTERLLMELREEGFEIAETDRRRIHGPAGLDLGGEGPEEIAQAIIAEIVAVKRPRAGGFLRDRPGRSTTAPAGHRGSIGREPATGYPGRRRCRSRSGPRGW